MESEDDYDIITITDVDFENITTQDGTIDWSSISITSDTVNGYDSVISSSADNDIIIQMPDGEHISVKQMYNDIDDLRRTNQVLADIITKHILLDSDMSIEERLDAQRMLEKLSK